MKAGGEPCGVAAAVAVAQASRRKGGWKVRVVGWKGGGVGENRRTKVERKIVFGIKRERERKGRGQYIEIDTGTDTDTGTGTDTDTDSQKPTPTLK